jgi:phospholipid/cholesterol/gamma-HCH transport system substrate-binding protein
MTERQIQFRVGVFVLLAMAAAGTMIFRFGSVRNYWEKNYPLAIHFGSAPGVRVLTPVQKNGIAIGKVSEIKFDEEQGGVTVVIEVREQFRLRKDSRPRIVRSLLGDASIDFIPGTSRHFLTPGDRLEGEAAVNPMEVVERLEGRMSATLESFHATSREWQRVGQNMNALMETNRGQLNVVVERTAEALEQFTLTMQNANQTLASANKILGDPEHQQNLKRTLAALPDLVEDTRTTIAAVRSAITKADQNLANLNAVTEPFAQRSNVMAANLDGTLQNLQVVTAELTTLSQALEKEDGSLRKFISDPELYRNTNQSAAVLAVLLQNLEPVVRDLRIFSDKIARHPELIGVRGAFQGSSGLKDPPPQILPVHSQQVPAPLPQEAALPERTVPRFPRR